MIKIIGFELGLIATHLVFVFFKFIPGDFSPILKIDTFLAILFVVGLLIVYPGIKKGAENFSIRFLLMTTLQLLLMLGLILVLAFNKIDHVKLLGLSAISVFVVLLVIQSFFLIKLINKK
jgi:hypothetical protein